MFKIFQGIQTDLADHDGTVDPRSVNQSQLHQSRLGLVSQALMLILIAGFLASETLSEFWKFKCVFFYIKFWFVYFSR